MLTVMVAGAQVVGNRKLTPQVRAGLDVARAAAAVYVVLHHVVHVSGPIGAVFSFGQEAVLVFFLLSGFVIFANERDRSVSPGGYYLRRLRRIYPPVMLVMLLSTVLWGTGLIGGDATWRSAAATLLSLQDISFLKPGVIADPYLENLPLWSLSYEVAFYIIFPLIMVLWRRSERMTRTIVPVVSVVAYATYLAAPNHFSLVLAYFLMWWAGAVVAHLWLNDRLHIRNALPELAGLLALAAAAGAGVIIYGFDGLGLFPFLIFRHAVFVVVLFLILFTPARRWMAGVSARVAVPAAAVASISYGLYVVHYPVMVQTGANQSWWIAPALLVTIALAWIADRGIPAVLPKAPRT